MNPKVKVVLVTSFEMLDSEFSNILPDVTMDAFITKPFTSNLLRNIIVSAK